MNQNLKILLANEIAAAESFDAGEIAATRTRAMDYYRGIMRDTPSQANRSKTMSHDVADTINWILPGLMRVFAASENLGIFQPLRADDKAFAEQATQYINYKFWKEWGGYRLLSDAIFDALLARNGIIKHYWDTSERFETSTHSGLSKLQLTDLVSDDDVEVLQSSETEDPEGFISYSVKIRRKVGNGNLRIDVVPPEDFLMDASASLLDEDEVRFCAHRDVKTRSDLIEMGFDRELVDQIPQDQAAATDAEKSAHRDEPILPDETSDASMQLVEIYECYLKTDIDDDGVAERVRAYMAGDVLLDWELWDDDLPFTDFVVSRVPHRFEGRSIADEVMDIQQIKTVLMRQAIDNTYGHNNPQREVEKGSVLNPEQLTNPKFGGIIHKKAGSQPIISHAVAYTADKSFMALDYFDQMIEKRTGVSRSTMALDPDALQNQTATAVQMGRESAYSKIELMARNLAEMGFKRLFKMLLRLVVKHQDRTDIIRLRDEFVEMDPRFWNASMDVTIDVGLGTGSRDKDMAMLGAILSNQMTLADKLSKSGFNREAIAMMPKIRQTLVKQAESAGMKQPENFYPELSPQALEHMAQKSEMGAGVNPQIAQQAREHADNVRLRERELELMAQLRREELAAEIALRKNHIAQNGSLEGFQPISRQPLDLGSGTSMPQNANTPSTSMTTGNFPIPNFGPNVSPDIAPNLAANATPNAGINTATNASNLAAK